MCAPTWHKPSRAVVQPPWKHASRQASPDPNPATTRARVELVIARAEPAVAMAIMPAAGRVMENQRALLLPLLIPNLDGDARVWQPADYHTRSRTRD